MTTLERCVLRLPSPAIDLLDGLADIAGVELGRNVSRAAVVRAAVEALRRHAATNPPEQVIDLIRLATVKRGRKPRKRCGAPMKGAA